MRRPPGPGRRGRPAPRTPGAADRRKEGKRINARDMPAARGGATPSVRSEGSGGGGRRGWEGAGGGGSKGGGGGGGGRWRPAGGSGSARRGERMRGPRQGVFA